MKISIWAIVGTLLLSWSVNAEAKQNRKILAEATCASRVGDVTLRLIQEQFDNFSEYGDPERLVLFRLERLLDTELGKAELVWQNETFYYYDVVPWPVWRAGLACNLTSNQIYVILACQWRYLDIELDFYPIQIDALAIGGGMPEVRITPRAPKLCTKAAVHHASRLSFDDGGLKSVEAIHADGHLDVVVLPCGKRAAPIHFEVDLETKEIRRVPEDPQDKGGIPP